ncbi:hypothetical protein F9C07_3006 [Aspergillus flavus]|uniref:Uncharacterized protein n=1 Tax=Aspergillus flavus (strain ATCC 200026 / FGSC A1120 / IAM 13836 / NRRL 3357 / JCM 12722 / SRRC 167) TaxID=332952 RepID=A0A7U2QRG9_ASPFN|nr:hypothetical protein F9C07_3006 [Aspergillus flavus]
MMAPVTSLDTLVRPFANFIIDSLEAAPFLSFVILALIYIFLASTVISLVFRLCCLAPATDNESQRACPTCDGSGVVDTTVERVYVYTSLGQVS